MAALTRAGGVRVRLLLLARSSPQPGAGKGTQCVRLAEKFGFQHLSTGDLMRAEAAKGTELGKEIASVMAAGALLPLDKTLELVQAAMDASPFGKFLLDGFPRTKEQLQAFERELQPCVFGIFFEVSEKVMLARLLERGKTSGRADDNPKSIKQRFKTFKKASLPVTKELKKAGGRLETVSADAGVDEVFARACEVFAARGFAPVPEPEPEPEPEPVPPPAAPEGQGPRDILVDAPAAVAKGLICCVIQ